MMDSQIATCGTRWVRPRTEAVPVRAILRAILLLCLLACTGAARGTLDLQPSVQFESLTVEEGLSHAMVYDFAQDGRGQLWIATQEGLNRYDGQRMEVFVHDRLDRTSLPNDLVRALQVDAAGRLWVGTERGIARFDRELNGFERMPLGDGPHAEALAGSIRSIAYGEDGRMWFGTADRGLVAAHPDTGEVEIWGVGSALGDDTVLALHPASDGRIWIGTQSAGLLWIDASTGRFGRPEHPALQDLPAVRSLHHDAAGRLWIGTDGDGALRLESSGAGWQVERFRAEDGSGLPDDRVRSIRSDTRSRIWFATDRGLAQWRDEITRFERYGHDEADARSLTSDRVNALFVDASGVLWVGTWAGASRWNHLSDSFTYLDVASGHLGADIVAAIAEGEAGILWIATYGGGLARVDRNSGATRVFRNDPTDPGSLPDDRVMAVFVDSMQRVWVGTRSAGLARLDPGSERFVSYRHDPSDGRSLAADAVTSVTSDADGRIWVGTFGAGLDMLVDAEAGHFEHLRHDPGDPRSLSGDRVLDLLSGERGRLWIGTDGAGLNVLDTERGTLARVSSFTLASEGSAAGDEVEIGTVADLHLGPDGSLWIATLGQGLLQWDAEARAAGTPFAVLFDRSRGAESDTVYCALSDGDGALWTSGNRGLTRLDPRSGNARRIDVRSGLRDSEFNQGACLRLADGQLLFGGVSGLVRFRPDALPFNEHPPRVRVDVSSRDALLSTAADGEATPTVQVGYLDPFLTFEFAALDFVSPDKNQFRYRLAGFDPDWIEAGNFGRAIYGNIPAGRYTFEVEGSNNDGVWSQAPARVEIVAIPPPWRSKWAYALYLIAAFALVAAYLRAQWERLEREIRQRAVLEEQVEVHTRDLARSNRELQRLNERLTSAALTDPITGLRNRRYIEQFLATEIAKFEREPSQPKTAEQGNSERSMFMMRVDIDQFSQVNERFGQAAGDRVLLEASQLLQAESRTADTLVRWASDEFLVVGTVKRYADACVLAGRLRACFRSHLFLAAEGHGIELTVSIGFAPYPFRTRDGQGIDWERVAAVAGAAVKSASRAGGDRWVSLAGSHELDADMLVELDEHLEALVAANRIVRRTSDSEGLRLSEAVT